MSTEPTRISQLKPGEKPGPGPDPQWVRDDMQEITMIAETLNENMVDLTVTRDRDAIRRIKLIRDWLTVWCSDTRAEEWTA